MHAGRARTKDSQQSISEHKWNSVFATIFLRFWAAQNGCCARTRDL